MFFAKVYFLQLPQKFTKVAKYQMLSVWKNMMKGITESIVSTFPISNN